ARQASARRPSAGPAPAASGRAPSSVALPAGEEVATIFGAVAARQRLAFRYNGGPRLVDPWRLSFRSGQWYLVAWDNTRNGSRTFRADRIEGAPEPIGEPSAFERPPAGSTAPPPPWQLGDDEEVTAILRVDADQESWAIGAAGTRSRMEMSDDGSVVLYVSVTNRAAFRTFVLGFLDNAQLLGPLALVDDLIEWLEQLAEPSAASCSPGSAIGATTKPAPRRAGVARAAPVPRDAKRAAASSGPPPVTLSVAAKNRPPGPLPGPPPDPSAAPPPGPPPDPVAAPPPRPPNSR
ncbi:MAG: WYL domain-containing protein, partial [Acidimicrobiales bacterium]